MLVKFIVFIFLISYIFTMIVFPFKTVLNNINSDNIDYNSTNYANDYFSQPAYITLKIGNPSQEVKFLLTYDDCGFKIGKTNKCINNDDYLSHYNRNSSEDFKYTNLFNRTSWEYKNGRSAEDTIYAYTDLEMKNLQKFENIGFYLGTDTDDALCGIIGLKPRMYRPYCDNINNIFTSFKSIKIINDNDWMIKYTSENEGLLILNPDLNKIVKNYDINKLFIMNNDKEKNFDRWKIMIDKVYSQNFNGSINNKPLTANINNDFGLFEGSEEYYYNITKTYFKDYILQKICYLDKIKVDLFSYYAIECDKTKFGIEDMKKFPILTLVIVPFQTEFNFDYNDLFTETKYKYFFNVIFNELITDRWVLGKPFLKKYPLIINYFSETIGYYNDQNKAEPTDNGEPGTSGIFSLKILIFLIIIIIIIIVIVSIIFYYIGKNMNQMKKRKANELEDDYDYTSSKENEKHLYDEPGKIN